MNVLFHFYILFLQAFSTVVIFNTFVVKVLPHLTNRLSRGNTKS